MPHPADCSVLEAAGLLSAGELSSEELVRACLERIAGRDGRYGAFIRVYEERALVAAAESDRRRALGTAGALDGIPVALKDLVGIAGLPLSGDSALLEGNVAVEDATVWSRLCDAGMVLVGHLHCGELAYGHWGVNPFDPALSPGGSSSGSAIALAARMVPATIGTDTRGSIRMPAAFTGCTAVKPTFGLLSTAGCIPLSFSYDVVGPMARTAADCAVLLAAMVGRDRRDRMTWCQQPPERRTLAPRAGRAPLAGTRIGVPDLGALLTPGVAGVLDSFCNELRALGATCVPFAWPASPLEGPGEGAPAPWTYILASEAALVHAQFAGREHLYREEFRRLFLPMIRPAATADYLAAQLARAELGERWGAHFDDLALDAVLHPASTGEAYRAAEDVTPEVLARLMLGTWNDTGFPVVSLPAGRSTTDGSPVGLQLAGRPFSEVALLQLAVDVQAASGHHLDLPAGLDGAGSPYAAPPRLECGSGAPFVPVRNPFDAVFPGGATLRG